MFTKDGVSLPMVTIMIEGGMQSIDQAVSTLRKGRYSKDTVSCIANTIINVTSNFLNNNNP